MIIDQLGTGERHNCSGSFSNLRESYWGKKEQNRNIQQFPNLKSNALKQYMEEI